MSRIGGLTSPSQVGDLGNIGVVAVEKEEESVEVEATAIKENKGKEATFFQVGLETCQFSKPKYVYTLTLKSDKHSIMSNM